MCLKLLNVVTNLNIFLPFFTEALRLQIIYPQITRQGIINEVYRLLIL